MSTWSVSRPSCIGPISWKNFDAVREEVARLAAATMRAGIAPENVLMTAVPTGQAARFLGNQFYRSHEEYVLALAAVLKKECDEIAAVGFILQLDCPDLAAAGFWFSECSDHHDVFGFCLLAELEVSGLQRASSTSDRKA